MRHYQSLLQSPHFYRWVNWGREKGTLSSRRERRRFRAWYPLQLLLSCLASASLLQGGFALLELRSITGDLALDSWSLVGAAFLPELLPCRAGPGKWQIVHPTGPTLGTAPMLFQWQGRWSDSGRQEAVTGGGKEKAILIPAGEREGGRKRVKEALNELHIHSVKSFINKTAKQGWPRSRIGDGRVSLAMGCS